MTTISAATRDRIARPNVVQSRELVSSGGWAQRHADVSPSHHRLLMVSAPGESVEALVTVCCRIAERPLRVWPSPTGAASIMTSIS